MIEIRQICKYCVGTHTVGKIHDCRDQYWRPTMREFSAKDIASMSDIKEALKRKEKMKGKKWVNC